MRLLSLHIQFLCWPERALALFAGVFVVFGLEIVVYAAEPPPAMIQSNTVATPPVAEARAGSTPGASQPATNPAQPAPIVGTSATPSNAPQATATNSPPVLDDTHKLTIGDRLSFRIAEDEGDPKPLFVTDSGDLDVPLIGRVPAENKTCQQLAAEIKTALEKDYYYHATVFIAVDLMTKSHGRVYLDGAVRAIGPLELPGDETLTLSKAILRAQGFTDYADRRHVRVTRKKAADAKTTAKEDSLTFTVDVEEILDKGKMEKDLTLEPGDSIFVPDRLIRW